MGLGLVGWGWLVEGCAGRFGDCAFELVGRWWVLLVCEVRWLRLWVLLGVCAVGFGVCAFELVGRCWVLLVCEVRWLRLWVVLYGLGLVGRCCWSVVCGLWAYLGAMLAHLGGYVAPA